MRRLPTYVVHCQSGMNKKIQQQLSFVQEPPSRLRSGFGGFFMWFFELSPTLQILCQPYHVHYLYSVLEYLFRVMSDKEVPVHSGYPEPAFLVKRKLPNP